MTDPKLKPCPCGEPSTMFIDFGDGELYFCESCVEERENQHIRQCFETVMASLPEPPEPADAGKGKG